MKRSNWLNTLAASALLLATFFAHASEIHVLSAVVKDKTIAEAEVIFQQTGAASQRVFTNASGVAEIPASISVDNADVTLIIKKPGYSNLVARCPCNGLTYAMSPVLTNLDGLRIVLQWGPRPQDLDSHLYSRNDHVYWDARLGRHAELDVDDVDGYGPETITIHHKEQGRAYVYAVHNFSERGSQGSTSLANRSQARVDVYIGSTLVRTFTPPAGTTGNTWVVFAIGENGEFYDINRFRNFRESHDVRRHMSEILTTGNFESDLVLGASAQQLAVQFNREGELEYHAGNMERAESLYLQAIHNNPEYAQAYSNLGLLYQRTGKSAEGLFANRKAIALASGSNSAAVKGGSYFNIARIYEDNGEWSAALINYRMALHQREHRAYRSGIERMQQKLAEQ